ncbi:hypothetical protein PAXRUDRAFT_830902 [Paxillus rubicundulus Ve08.2h10]|uniref:Uncharacterized protein n=1 Tax=Paxillus rubicundulus Ve08.2h10 TaxID=930991 RepID=A0A0D0DXY1_9AGAM|nr:hypothetical protein PAXRUDRAFT_830902 [Paxillus rubicundulus Ve08.2h10]
MTPADTALTETLRLMCDNIDLLSRNQCNMLLDSQESLRKQHQELEPRSWFSLGSDKSKKHLDNCQRLLTQVKEVIEATKRTNARSGRVSLTSTNRGTDTTRASISQPSINSRSLQDGAETMTMSPNAQSAKAEVLGSETPSVYATALMDAINTPLETSVASTSNFSILRPTANEPAPRPTAQPKRQSQTTEPASIKSASQPWSRAPSQPRLAAKQTTSGQGAGNPTSYHSGYTRMTNCVTLNGFASADGLTIQRGGTGNTGSVINKIVIP